MSSCVSCGSPFTFFRKEHGCPNCGFSLCSKCLSYKIPVPKLNGALATVCKACHEKMAGASATQQNTMDYLPPRAIQEKLNQLEDPSKPPIVVYTHTSRFTDLKRGLATEDKAIVDRLEKLRKDMKELRSTPSQEEIEQRLAKLKGVDPQVYSRPFTIPPQMNRGVDPITALLDEMNEETMIDQNSGSQPKGFKDTDDPDVLLYCAGQEVEREAREALKGLEQDKEIRQRLAQLRVQQGEKLESYGDSAPCMDEDDDEDAAAAKIIQKALDENALKKMEDIGGSRDSIDEELPWCQLCNEDGQVRCHGCGGDIYCRSCWKQVHGAHDPGYRSHISSPYRPCK